MRSAETGLPKGTVTFVFTDIESSTRLIQSLGDRYPMILTDHRGLIREAISHRGGIEVSTEGDSFFIVFRSAHDAISAVAEIQRSIAGHDWPADGQVKVRIGVHTGEGLVEGDDYIGLDVHRASRIADAGYGDQVVLSESTAAALGRTLPDGLELVDLGKHRLKDLTEPETLYQLGIPGIRSDFPPLRTLEGTPNNLPVQLTSFVGREDVMSQALALFAENRILTLTGPGGTGKTRLSLQMAGELSGSFDDGVFFVPLAPVSDPELVASAVLDAIGLAAPSAKTPEDFLVSQLEDRKVLLVMDNFEHVVAAAPLVSRLAQASSASKFLVTSRVPLAVGGEQEMPVPPLRTTGVDAAGDVSQLMQVERVRLFVERAVSVRPDFQLTEDNAAAVVALVDRLDGLPLAIELVASQLKLLTPQSILGRLDLRTLASHRRDLPERQSTLWGAIEWSFRLLEEPERQLFSRLSVFAGGARLEEIEGVCAQGLRVDLVSLLGRLADHSLIRSTLDPEPRFLMLYVIREFAAERLEASGEAEQVRRSHAMAYSALAERVQPELIRKDRKRWLDRLTEDVDNLRAALIWAIKSRETDLASKIAFHTWRFWQGRGYLYEAEARINEILGLPVETPFWRAKALEAAGGIAWWRGDSDSSREIYRQALEIHRRGDDRVEVANALYNLGLATPDLQAGALGAEEPADQVEPERIAEAHRLLAEAEEIYTSLGDAGGLADVVWGRGNVKLLQNDQQGHLEDSLRAAELYRQVGNVFGLGWALFEAGWAHRDLGNLDAAWSFLSQALEQFGEQEDISAVVLHLSALSSLAKEQDNMTRAVTLAGAMHQLRLKSGSDIASLDINVVGGLEFETLEDLTGELANAYQRGKAMDLASAVRYALTAG